MMCDTEITHSSSIGQNRNQVDIYKISKHKKQTNKQHQSQQLTKNNRKFYSRPNQLHHHNNSNHNPYNISKQKTHLPQNNNKNHY